jgi:hypothetical protein
MTPRGAEMANVPGARPSRNCSSGRRTSRSNPRRLAGGDHARLDPRRGKGSFPILQGRRAQVQPWIRNTGESADWLQASAITGCHGHFAPGIARNPSGRGWQWAGTTLARFGRPADRPADSACERHFRAEIHRWKGFGVRGHVGQAFGGSSSRMPSYAEIPPAATSMGKAST